MRNQVLSSVLLSIALVLGATVGISQAQDVPFLESPESVVQAMLELADVGTEDVVYDLGSGDGRIVIAAALQHEAKAIGIESDAELVRLSDERANEAGVADLVEFVQADLFESDFSDATVVMMYLYPKVNERLRPILAKQLAPGTPVVSHRYKIGGWTPEERIKVEGRFIYLYKVPEQDAAP